MVADIDGRVAGSFQLTILSHLAGQGRPVARAEEMGCRRVQLTSNKRRKDAHRFYERLGFHATHEGFKTSLRPGRGS
jgi:GNAT superfamily N-acetyltransferase